MKVKSGKQKSEILPSLPQPGDKYYWHTGGIATVTSTGSAMTSLRAPNGRHVLVPTGTLATRPKVKLTSPLQTCGDPPKKRKTANHKSQIADGKGGKLVVVLVTPEEVRAVHRFLNWAHATRHSSPDRVAGGFGRLVPLMQGIARGWLIQA